MLQGGGRSLEDIRELKYEKGLMKLIDIDKVPDPDSASYQADLINELEKDKVKCAITADMDSSVKTLRELRKQENLFEGGKYFHHVVATNWDEQEKNAHEVLQWHNQRGEAENFNKELKNGFGMERMPCGQTEANAVFFRIGIIAYNLFIGFKRLSCPELWLKHIPMHRDDNSLEADTSSRPDSETFRKHPDASGLSADFKKLELFKGIRKSIEELFSYKL